jgi:hypothetical protein
VRRAVVALPVLGAPMSRTRDAHLRALELAVDAAGKAWAIGFAEALGREGRSVAGGFPGTISEARARVVQCVAGRPRAITQTELDALTRRAYDVARRFWLQTAGPTPNEDT